MATLGIWFIGVGVANALLGGIAVRITDPMIRGLAIERFLGFPWGVWLALACLARRHRHPGPHPPRPLPLRARRRRGPGRALRHPVRPRAHRRLHHRRRLLRRGRHPRRGAARPRQRADRPGRLFTTVTAVVVGGTALSGGEGGVLQTLVGVLIVVVLANGMVLMGMPPERPDGVQGLMIIVAVALSIDRAQDAGREMTRRRPSWRSQRRRQELPRRPGAQGRLASRSAAARSSG